MREAADRGYDEALLLDARGNLAECSGENLFVVRKQTLCTNDERSSILLGITRASVIDMARNLGYAVEVRPIQLHELLEADEAFVTGTAAEVTPVKEVDGVRIGSGARGPITERLQHTYFQAAAGLDPKYRDWLCFVGDAIIRPEVGNGRHRPISATKRQAGMPSLPE